MNMIKPTTKELRELAMEEDRVASWHDTQLRLSNLDEYERAIENRMKRKARIYAHALRRWADSLEEAEAKGAK